MHRAPRVENTRQTNLCENVSKRDGVGSDQRVGMLGGTRKPISKAGTGDGARTHQPSTLDLERRADVVGPLGVHHACLILKHDLLVAPDA
jgi:hypothetical protein